MIIEFRTGRMEPLSPARTDSGPFYSDDQLDRVRGDVTIAFPRETIVRQDWPILILYVEICNFLHALLSDGEMCALNLFFEPVAYGRRVGDSIRFYLFNPATYSGEEQDNLLEVVTVREVRQILEKLAGKFDGLFGSLGPELKEYVSGECPAVR